MAFAFGGSASSGAAGTGAQARAGEQLPEINTESFGFRALAGEKKLRLLPKQWPDDALPPPTSSLLSVASRKGLVAAAGPATLVLATTDAIRKAFADEGPKNEKVKDFAPQLSIDQPRLSQVAFSSDEAYLVISAESGGGLAVYDVDSILKNNKDPAFQLPTNGLPLRAIAPNPAPEAGHLFALVLTEGQLLIADLKERKLVNGSNGPILKEGVSCVCWSVRGKQLVAGLGDGTAVQMKPDGTFVAEIPRPPGIEGGQHVSSITWLANDEFLVIHTPTVQADAADSTPHYVLRDKGTTNFTFSGFELMPLGSWGMERNPAHQFILRLKDFPPALEDVLIMAATNTADVGVLSKSSEPLSQELQVTHKWTTTSPTDQRRAAAPLNAEGNETSPIGLALDLSSRDKVLRPIPSQEEITESPTPLPEVMLLNNEGLLSAWWIVYDESIKRGTGYPALVALSGEQPAQQPALAQPASPFSTASPAAAKPTFASPLAKPAAPAFGSPSFGTGPAKPAFGSSTSLGSAGAAFSSAGALGSKPAFGAPSLGAPKSPWAAAASPTGGANQTAGAAFGKPAFGSSTAFGAAASGGFGSVGGLANKASPWGTPAGNAQQQTEAAKLNPFGTPSTASAASAAKPNPFGAAATSGTSPFAKFSSQGTSTSPFGTSAFGQPQAKPAFAANSTGTSFGMKPESSFGSTVTIDSTAGGGSTLGKSSFGASSFGGTSAQPFGSFGQSSFASQTQESEMGDADAKSRSEATPTPQASSQTPAQGSLFGAGAFKLGSTFKPDGTAKDDLPKPAAPSGGSLFGSAFGKALGDVKPEEPSTPIKQEPGTEAQPNVSTTPASPATFGNAFQGLGTAPAQPTKGDAPAPQSPPAELKSPEPTKTPAKPTIPEDAPLPPDFLPKKSSDPVDQFDLPPIAGSPPVSVQAPSSPLSEGESEKENVDEENEEEEDEEEENDEGEDEEEDEDDEGDKGDNEEDEADGGEQTEEISFSSPEQPKANNVFDSPSWSFASHTPQDTPLPRASSPSKARGPSQSQSNLFGASTTPAGFPKKAPIFAPPTQRKPEALRSPSPVRPGSTQLGLAGGRRHVVPLGEPVSRPKPAEPEPAAELSDDEDLQVQKELEKDVPRKTELSGFLAHQDYTGKSKKQGIPGQIELLYRDINSMVDTLGLNARNMAAFVKGHTEPEDTKERTREDLNKFAYEQDEQPEWLMCEIADLDNIMNQMEEDLDKGRVTDVHAKLAEIVSIQKSVKRLRSRLSEIRRIVDAHTDPRRRAALDQAPLSSEQNKSLRKLRDGFAELQKMLQESEESLVLLKTKLATVDSRSGKPKQAVPTVEAVTKTIMTMTSMVEKKNADLDFLEAQLRRLRVTSERPSTPGAAGDVVNSVENGTPGAATPSFRRSVRGESPFATPPTSRSARYAVATPLDSSVRSIQGKTYGSYYGTPDANGRGSVTPESADVQTVSKEALASFVARQDKRRAIARKMQEIVQQRNGIKRVGPPPSRSAV